MIEASELRNKSTDELKEELRALLREQFNLRMQKITQGTQVKSHYFTLVRRNIARLKTILHEKAGQK